MTTGRFTTALALALLLTACATANPAPTVLRLATTTSTDDSGLLDAILPDFEARYNARVDVVAVGTGQALALGEAGDADVLLVHAPALEEAFVAEGYGTARYPVMYNDFVVVGPPDDPAGIAGMASAPDALAAIAAAETAWASRGDNSGTHNKELALWDAARSSVAPDPAQHAWYNSLGQGMGATLQFANETGAYTLADRGTFLSQRDSLPNLIVLVGGLGVADNPDTRLYNPYSVISVSPRDGASIDVELTERFVAWITALYTQEQIAAFGIDEFGQPLFYPDARAWRASH